MVVAVISSQAALLRGELDAVMGVFETSYRVERCYLRATPRTGVGIEGWLEGRHARFSSRGGTRLFANICAVRFSGQSPHFVATAWPALQQRLTSTRDGGVFLCAYFT